MESRTALQNPLIHNLHDYCMADKPLLSVVDPEFPPLPITPSSTPSKPPAPKKMKANRSLDKEMDEGSLVQQISTVLNTRLDSLEKNMEKLISENTLKIEGLKQTIDFICADIREVKEKVTKVDAQACETEKKMCAVDQRVAELENYSRRWNLRLYGVPENKEQDVRTQVMKICQAILPEYKTKLPDAIDTVHRLGQPKKDVSKPRGIIMQFTGRFYRDKT